MALAIDSLCSLMALAIDSLRSLMALAIDSLCSLMVITNMYYIYILRSVDNYLYIGQTINLKKRVREHIEHLQKASKFTKEHNNFELVYKETFNTRLDSMRREKQLKGWTRAKKEALICGNLKLLKKL